MSNFEHGGNIYYYSKILGCKPEEILDLSSNIWPLSMSKSLEVDINLLQRLPSVHGEILRKLVAEKFNLNEKNILFGCGTSEIIKEICNIYAGKRALILAPTYSDYERYSYLYNLKVDFLLAEKRKGFYHKLVPTDFKNYDVVFICNPNNPTGILHKKERLYEIFYLNEDVLFVVDESYIEFVKEFYNKSFLGEDLDNLIVLRSFSKSYGLAGLRVGFAYAFNEKILKKLSNYMLDWGISSLAEDLLSKLIATETDMGDFFEVKHFLFNELKKISNIKVYESEANFFLIELLKCNSSYLFERMLEKKILIRKCDNFRGLSDKFIRISVKPKSSILKFLKLFEEIMR